MVLSYKYKLEPTNDQKLLLNNHFFIFNQAWNITISSHIKSRDEGLPYLDNTELDRMIKPILKDRNLSFNTKIVQRAIALANQAIQTNYKNQKNRKSKDSNSKFSDVSYRVSSEPKQVIETTKEQYSLLVKENIGDIGDGNLNVGNKIGILRLFREDFKYIKHRPIPENYEVKNVKISKDGDEYFIIFSCHAPISKPLEDRSRVGIDFNLHGLDIGNQGFHQVAKFSELKKVVKNYDVIKRLKRKQSRRVLKAIDKAKTDDKKVRDCLSKNFLKTQKRINKKYEKVRNYRSDYLHKFVNSLLDNLVDIGINHVVVENLDIKQMTSKENIVKLIGKARSKSMRKNILALAPGQLYNILEYKCTKRELYFQKVDPKNTSKTCSSCGAIKQALNLSDRVYNCDNCGTSIDRDYNACLNILKRAS